MACCHLVAAAGMAQSLGEAKGSCCCPIWGSRLPWGPDQQLRLLVCILEAFPSVPIGPIYPSGHDLNHSSTRLLLATTESNFGTAHPGHCVILGLWSLRGQRQQKIWALALSAQGPVVHHAWGLHDFPRTSKCLDSGKKSITGSRI